ncbi:type III pantothenate kinase [Namhaeicola litoreus]|uniref:Type III pantothenate kinase n=1 Tax=Namhaeicola litoreus TaxID=1052145 RepID=A0ABW3XZ40_9FLAO
MYVFLPLTFFYPMNLIIDIGNTLVKTAVFERDSLKYKSVFNKDNLADGLIQAYNEFDISHVIMSNVSHFPKDFSTLLPKNVNILILDQNTKVPFNNFYKTPQTLGVDRIALMAGAALQYSAKNCLVIDAGSCITYDFLDQNNNYYGGAISPGIEMRYKALHQQTAKLPHLKPINEIPVTGNSTENAIHLGVLNGVIQEIEGIIAQYLEIYENFTTILTGGDANFLSKNLKSTIFAKPNFLLEGLNGILIHNLDE